MSFNIGKVLSIGQLALNATPEEVNVVHNVIQAPKTSGTAGLLGAVIGALPEELELISAIVAAVHSNNQQATAQSQAAAQVQQAQAQAAAQVQQANALQAAAPQVNITSGAMPVEIVPGQKRDRDLKVTAEPGSN